ncbi:MAG TPA: aminotransferase class I/II-fold pyridoxal phosphate-dependent enzyme, partial [Trueperaceae bacterium]|nr:aminotransferase class I/II-fold pyridoxal phosphate-dependent enzyme [Trueperaceae bacterium]
SVVLLRTFSKALGLAGARLGYALAAPELAVHLRKVLLPFSVSALQVAAGLAALERPEAVAQRVTAVVAERERLAAALRTFPGIEVFPSVTNFVLFRVDDPGAVHSGLLERGVVVRRQDHLPGLEGCLRVTAGLPQENDAFLRALEGVLAAEAARG